MQLIQTFKTHCPSVTKPVQPSHCAQHTEQQPKPHGRTKINLKHVRFQGSVTESSRPLLFWDVWLCTLVADYRSFRTTYQSHLEGSSTSYSWQCQTFFNSIFYFPHCCRWSVIADQNDTLQSSQNYNKTAQNQQHPLFHCIFTTPQITAIKAANHNWGASFQKYVHQLQQEQRWLWKSRHYTSLYWEQLQ